jgi:diadenosine tetraphosphate (Ap4A) HIT family hydrolase
MKAFTMQPICPFCNLDPGRIRLENAAAIALPDAFPVAEGHTLVVPRRHVASLFDLSEEEQAAVWRLVAEVRAKLATELHPDGFNIGVNDGPAAGQTVMHAHVHVIPRRKGDAADPRGGVRWIKPEKARYWGEGSKRRGQSRALKNKFGSCATSSDCFPRGCLSPVTSLPFSMPSPTSLYSRVTTPPSTLTLGKSFHQPFDHIGHLEHATLSPPRHVDGQLRNTFRLNVAKERQPLRGRLDLGVLIEQSMARNRSLVESFVRRSVIWKTTSAR